MDQFEKLSVEVKSLVPSKSIADDVIRVEARVELSTRDTDSTVEDELANAISQIVDDRSLFIDISIPENNDKSVLQGDLKKSLRVVLRSGWSKELETADSLYSSQIKSVIKQAFSDTPVWDTFGALEMDVENFKRSSVFYYGIEADLTVRGVPSEDDWEKIFEYMQTIPGESYFIGNFFF